MMISVLRKRMRRVLTGWRRVLTGWTLLPLLLAIGAVAALLLVNARYAPASWQPMLAMLILQSLVIISSFLSDWEMLRGRGPRTSVVEQTTACLQAEEDREFALSNLNNIRINIQEMETSIVRRTWSLLLLLLISEMLLKRSHDSAIILFGVEIVNLPTVQKLIPVALCVLYFSCMTLLCQE